MERGIDRERNRWREKEIDMARVENQRGREI
jgi:hypothetical protein